MRATCPAHLSFLDLTFIIIIIIIIICKGVQIMKLLFGNFLQHPVSFYLLDPKTFLSTLFPHTLPGQCLSHNVGDQIPNPNKTTGTTMDFYMHE
jgi:hypothetical protein